MKIKLWISVALLLAAPAVAQQQPVADDHTAYVVPRVPDEATKAWALKRAFQLNNNSMVGNNRMIDLSRETPFINSVKTERVAPIVDAKDKNEMDEAADLNMGDLRKFSRRFNMKVDVCARHHMRKVASADGKSWRCK
jgi:hypothetical protein